MNGTSGSVRTAADPLWSVLLVPALGAATGACGAVLAGSGGGRPAGGSDSGALIGLAAAAIGCAVVVAWALAAVLAVLAVLAGHHHWERLAGMCGRCSPALLRRAAAAALGLQLLTATGAAADDTPSPFWGAGASVQETAAPAEDATVRRADAPTSAPGAREAPGPAPEPDSGIASGPGPGLDRELDPDGEPASPTPPDPCLPRTGPSAAERTVDGAVTVVRGDTLWSLAAADLGPEASDEQVARAWPRWYELNRHVLAGGPHLLLPGQRLLVPGAGGP